MILNWFESKKCQRSCYIIHILHIYLSADYPAQASCKRKGDELLINLLAWATLLFDTRMVWGTWRYPSTSRFLSSGPLLPSREEREENSRREEVDDDRRGIEGENWGEFGGLSRRLQVDRANFKFETWNFPKNSWNCAWIKNKKWLRNILPQCVLVLDSFEWWITSHCTPAILYNF